MHLKDNVFAWPKSKCKQVACSAVAAYFVFTLFIMLRFVVDCLFVNPFFIMMLLPCFYLFIDNVNKTISFVFGNFVYHFEFNWSRMSLPAWNLYKCKQVACSVVVDCFVFTPSFMLHFVVAYLLLNHFFIQMLLL